ncbi:GGDEF domain-containing protein [Streptomyces fuscigenes]|uniref:GGDEF domain-containing protein n=1 Tax=Streptomyces fuscigenes TaxID=1528880 RepID=UPI001F29959D|nr:GGDEF domain-containing protein [Streptomyces fuscigenes]MCF3960393.1 GGDEF domain-containing protein [Streptomyces fuscigenes]
MDPMFLAAVAPVTGWALHGSLLARRLSTARRDPLTGLHTRGGFTARAERIIRRSPGAVAVLVDLDDFKQINDHHGHAAGDAVIAATGLRLASWVSRHGVAARLGGDEFAALVTAESRTAGLPALTAALCRPVLYDGRVLPVSASLGVCRLTDLALPRLTDALSAADAAMYVAKGHGRRNR